MAAGVAARRQGGGPRGARPGYALGAAEERSDDEDDLDRLTLTLTPKPDAGRRRSRRRLSPLRRLPPELLRRVVG